MGENDVTNYSIPRVIRLNNNIIYFYLNIQVFFVVAKFQLQIQ
jgi:hypothetical protein